MGGNRAYYLISLSEIKLVKAIKNYAKADVSVFCSCLILLDFFTFFKYFLHDCSHMLKKLKNRISSDGSAQSIPQSLPPFQVLIKTLQKTSVPLKDKIFLYDQNPKFFSYSGLCFNSTSSSLLPENYLKLHNVTFRCLKTS